MELSNLQIASANASFAVQFSLDGMGEAYATAPFDRATVRIYTDGRNDALVAKLRERGLKGDKYQMNFRLLGDKPAILAAFAASARAALIAAILDGSATWEVRQVGCDYVHPQIAAMRVNGQDVDFALIQDALGSLNLSVDGAAACADLAGAIRRRQAERIGPRLAPEPLRCWECGNVRPPAGDCPFCGEDLIL